MLLVQYVMLCSALLLIVVLFELQSYCTSTWFDWFIHSSISVTRARHAWLDFRIPLFFLFCSVSVRVFTFLCRWDITRARVKSSSSSPVLIEVEWVVSRSNYSSTMHEIPVQYYSTTVVYCSTEYKQKQIDWYNLTIIYIMPPCSSSVIYQAVVGVVMLLPSTYYLSKFSHICHITQQGMAYYIVLKSTNKWCCFIVLHAWQE